MGIQAAHYEKDKLLIRFPDHFLCLSIIQYYI